MSTELIATNGNGHVAAQTPARDMAPAQVDVLKYLGLDRNDIKAQALVAICNRYNLDPILKHVLLIGEGSKRNLYVTRDGLLHAAHMSGDFDGIEVLEQSENATHWTARVAVYRRGFGRPVVYPGRYPKSGMNKLYGPEMAIARAESMALRRAFDIALSSVDEINELEEIGSVVTGSNPSLPNVTAASSIAPPPPANGVYRNTVPAPPERTDVVDAQFVPIADAAPAAPEPFDETTLMRAFANEAVRLGAAYLALNDLGKPSKSKMRLGLAKILNFSTREGEQFKESSAFTLDHWSAGTEQMADYVKYTTAPVESTAAPLPPAPVAQPAPVVAERYVVREPKKNIVAPFNPDDYEDPFEEKAPARPVH